MDKTNLIAEKLDPVVDIYRILQEVQEKDVNSRPIFVKKEGLTYEEVEEYCYSNPFPEELDMLIFESAKASDMYDLILLVQPVIQLEEQRAKEEFAMQNQIIEYPPSDYSDLTINPTRRRSIFSAKKSFRDNNYGDAIQYLKNYLRKSVRPSFEAYAMIGLSYLGLAESHKDNAKKVDKAIEERRIGRDFLRIYNVLCGQYNYNQFNYQRFLDEVNLWLDNQRPIEAIQLSRKAHAAVSSTKKKNPDEHILNPKDKTVIIAHLDTSLLALADRYIVEEEREQLENGTFHEITLEYIGEKKRLTSEVIDRIKLNYARNAIRAHLPGIAKRYIQAVRDTKGKNEFIKRLLSKTVDESKYSISDEREPLDLIYYPPGKRTR